MCEALGGQVRLFKSSFHDHSLTISFLLSEQEHSRTTSTSEIDDRTMHEIYAHPFLRSIMAGVGGIMCSYS